ncbi:enoyl-CoA hydratase/isomerase family protein [Mycobacterium sp. Aquia_216]|uniref:enoyl-CoA hydratase/isomerase family protein n=1 Tax=Mycobacterium sp. Aquia_216 TaxID=2991729 RepID=UPI00227AF711|nr:enoyl-CoA hydratase/isomerase family protein [Mycobacterium sp. Aquia_216]WAJ44338.1 enoyl-CoA hydratase/isomerase family protein [Mycobacterium sp. Aquia_216]
MSYDEGQEARDFGDVIALPPRDGVGTVVLNRPQMLNAVREATFVGLRDAARWLAGSADCGAVVLRGAGRAFCAGLDLKGGLTGAEPGDRTALMYRAVGAGAEAVATLREIPQPVVAAVRGAAIGAGLSLAVAADLRVCASDARFGAPFVHVGMSAGDLGLSWLLPRIIGTAKATSILLQGGSLSSAEARQVGLVNEVAEDPDERAVELAHALADQPRLATAMTKLMLNNAHSNGFREHLSAEVAGQVVGSMTQEHAAALAALTTRQGSPSE